MSDINAILLKFRNVRESGSGYMACCPAHEDGSASLSIGTGTDGKILLNCKAGCTFDAVITAAGVSARDLFPQVAAPSKPASREIVTTYPYCDKDGTLLYEVVRFKPKDFRQRRPDGQGGYIWDMKGIDRVLYRLPELLAAKSAGTHIYVSEGEKDVDNLRALGLAATCNVGGAGKWDASYTAALAGAHIVIIADRDEPGRKHGALVASALHGKAAPIQVIELPDRGAVKVKDASDWLAAGGTAAELEQIVGATPEWTAAGTGASQAPPPPPEGEPPPVTWPPGGKKILVLPASQSDQDHYQSIHGCAAMCFAAFADALTMFNRGRKPVEIIEEKTADAGTVKLLKPIGENALRSRIEDRFVPCGNRSDGKGGYRLMAVTPSKDIAAALLETREVQEMLPPIAGLSCCPMLLPDGRILTQGYDRASGWYVIGGAVVENITVAEAVKTLDGLLAGFDFTTPSDKSRALAAFFSPTLRLGRFFSRVPVDVAEANVSQSGKTFRQQVVGAIYGSSVRMIGKLTGGVGSLDETFATRLFEGNTFVQFDNLRGKLDSSYLEMFMTAKGRTFPVRVPHVGTTDIDPANHVVFLSSNGVELTPDMGNRCCLTRIRKQPADYVYPTFDGLPLLAYVEKRQGYVLGCVFAILREWIRRGRPATTETRHDFREWVGSVDWIVRELFHGVPVMDGHQEARERTTDPNKSFVREVAIVCDAGGQLGQAFTARDIYLLTEDRSLKVPGLKDENEDAGAKRIGVIMRGAGLKDAPAITVDGYLVERHDRDIKRPDGSGYWKQPVYVFTRPNPIPQYTAVSSTTIIENPPISKKDITLTAVYCGSGNQPRNGNDAAPPPPITETAQQPAFAGGDF